MSSATHTPSRRLTLMLGALGVVFGDIGTSPLYAIKESFSKTVGLEGNTENVLGILSLIFWLLTIVVSLKYLLFIMRADNKGEGGALVLHALALRTTNKFWLRRLIIMLGIIGAGLFYGDSIITPAISVLSAMEGLEVAMPQVSSLIMPLSLVVLVVLFAVQRHGTASVGRFFGPIMVVWFIVIGGLGLHGIVQNPVVLSAINPYHAVHFAMIHLDILMLVLGAVVLSVTGAEAIYADMGHFGRRPIQRAWFFVAMPGLLLSYFGQGALIMGDPAAIENPFFILAPEWFRLPLVILSTMATVIASQATISGAFSMTRQAVQLGYLPRVVITHTSEHEAGQIYIPFVNIAMMISVVLVVLTFKTSSNLAAAYAIAICGMMVITVLLAFQVSHKMWKWPVLLSVAVCLPLFLIDLLLFSSNLHKLMDGGWFTLAVAALVFLVMLTWIDGSRFLYKQISGSTMPLKDFINGLPEQNVTRVSGTAVFLVRTTGDTPHALLRNFRHNHVLHNRVIILYIGTRDTPRVARCERYKITDMGSNFLMIEAYYGFMELPSIPLLMRQCVEEGKLQLDMGDTSFFVSRSTLVPDPHMGLPLWQAVLYQWLYLNSVRMHDFYRIPTNKVLEIGIQVRV
jgi:KUP system potassium uptake protein